MSSCRLLLLVVTKYYDRGYLVGVQQKRIGDLFNLLILNSNMGLIWVLIFMSYTNPNKTRKNPVGKDMGVVFQYPMGTGTCLLYTSPSPRDGLLYRMPSSA